ncbi:unnamed protein product [Arabidopsis lyrata]|uniref:Uncharacterized protein n=1 Tax=Arabidopsis lyrata subsp. lyrata TaxID=81972 RepID=D7KXY2_ARALL|nr:hypothetical protein ARALYDRAFT_894809 [Arabidopsis lyrata subsp. lyrata]CAH8257680.1 unnamed protein product [Arabidopsis lyrata]
MEERRERRETSTHNPTPVSHGSTGAGNTKKKRYIGGLTGENIIKDIKEKRKVKFGSQLFLTDCRKGMTGVLSYVCDDTTLRFEPDLETKATKFGNNPTCTNI